MKNTTTNSYFDKIIEKLRQCTFLSGALSFYENYSLFL